MRSETYDGDEEGTLLSRSESVYDDLGRVYQSTSYAVDPTTGTVGNGLTGYTWYDAAGNTIKSQPAGSKVFSKTEFDSLGRAVATYVGYCAGETSYSEASSLACNSIVEQSETMFDEVGNVIFAAQYQRMHTASGMGELNGPGGDQPKARVTYTAAWHDGIGRPIAAAAYGTGGGSVPTRPDSAPASSDTVLVGTTEYNATGEAFKSVDPAGREDRREFDALGRVTESIQNYTDGNPSTGGADEDVLVETSYTADGQVSTLVAKNSSTGDQTTTYVYGTTLENSDIARADLLRAEILPDSDDTSNPLGSGQDTVYDRVAFAYNRLGQVIEKKDQNGTVHEFTFDGLGRQTSDRVTTAGTGIDDAVLRLSTTFEKRGLPEKLTSYDADTGGNVVNEVKRVHNDFGQLVTEYQEHEGAVNTSTTPSVGYTYPDGSGGHIRLQKTTYPNGRVLRNEYNTGLDDAMNRVSYLADDDNGSVGTHLAAYSYLGAGMIACEDLCQPQVRLDRDHGVAGEYAGWDRFGRVVDHRWRDYGASTDRDRYTHGYDRAGNRLYRENTTTSGKDEFYSYDSIFRLTNFDRGDLNAGKTAISGTPAREEDFTLDPTGNWTDYVQKTSGSTDLDQDRTHNKANEITDVTETTGTAWITPAHDAAGNMTTVPKPSSLANGLTCKYDAWNRLIEVKQASDTVAIYEYDGLGRRVVRGVDTASPGDPDGTLDTFEHFLYGGVSVVETRDASAADAQAENLQPHYQYVWSARYVDAPVLRDENTDTDDTCDDGRVYYLTDALGNVTALVSDTGVVLERYVYDPYGQVTIYDDDWSDTRGSSSYQNTRLYTGRELDPTTGLYYYRARWYDTGTGNFTTRDPLGFAAGDANLYRYVGNRPVGSTDPSGLWEHYGSGGGGSSWGPPPEPPGFWEREWGDAYDNLSTLPTALAHPMQSLYAFSEGCEQGSQNLLNALTAPFGGEAESGGDSDGTGGSRDPVYVMADDAGGGDSSSGGLGPDGLPPGVTPTPEQLEGLERAQQNSVFRKGEQDEWDGHRGKRPERGIRNADGSKQTNKNFLNGNGRGHRKGPPRGGFVRIPYFNWQLPRFPKLSATFRAAGPALGPMAADMGARWLNDATKTRLPGERFEKGIMERTVGDGPMHMIDNINGFFGGDPHYFRTATEDWWWGD